MLTTITRLAFAAGTLLIAANAAPLDYSPLNLTCAEQFSIYDPICVNRVWYGIGPHDAMVERWQTVVQPESPEQPFGLVFMQDTTLYYYDGPHTDMALIALYPDIPQHFQNYIMTSQGWLAPSQIEALSAPASVPEPATWGLFAGGLALLAFFRRQRTPDHSPSLTATDAKDLPLKIEYSRIALGWPRQRIADQRLTGPRGSQSG